MLNQLIIFIWIFSISPVWAETSLPFPQTTEEFVQALTPESKFGKPKSLGDPKGFSQIADDMPKAGALIAFAYDSDRIEPESHVILKNFAKALQGGLAEAHFEISGHTDNQGEPDYNVKLSQRRAKAVQDFLVSVLDIPAQQLETQGYGKSQPIATNETESGRTLNRRVEFKRLR